MKPATKRSLRRNLTGYCFILPNFLGFLLFTSGPVIVSLCLAFTKWDIIAPAEFVGLANFRQMLGDLKFGKYLWNTVFMMGFIPVAMGLSLLMALILNQKIRGRTFFRTLFFLPSITAGIAVYILWGRLYNKDFGLLGRNLPGASVWMVSAIEALGLYLAAALCLFLLCRLVLDFIKPTVALRISWFLLCGFVIWVLLLLNVLILRGPGGPAIIPGAAWVASLEGIAGASGWLRDPWLAKPSIGLMRLWAAMGGYNMILYLAALQNVDPGLYEAANIDGANAWRKFLHITWPMITPTTFFIFITSCIGGFQGGFESAYIMTNGGPTATGVPWAPWAGETVSETTTLSYYIFNNAYVYLRMGYAAAMAWFLFLLIFVVTMVNWRYGGRRVEYA